MEIEIPFSVKISLIKDKANINDMVKAIRRVLEEIDKYLLKQALKQWEEEIVAAFCALWPAPCQREKRWG